MKTLLKYSTMFLLTATAFILSSCKEDLSYTPLSTEPPVIESITPLVAPKNSEITIKGESLNTVYKAFIGEQEVEISSKVTDKHIVLVANGTTDGKIRLMATVGNTLVETTSEESFTYDYVAPTINETQLPAKVEVGTSVLLMGQNMQSAEDIFIIDGDVTRGASDPVKVKIETKNDKEITFKMPYVDFTTIAFYATYYNGSEIVADAPVETTCEVVVKHPVVSSVSATALTENQSFTITGTDLDKITSVMIGELKATISDLKATSVKVTVPPGFADGMNSDIKVTLKYFDDAATMDLAQKVSVFVPEIMLGKDQTLTSRQKKGVPPDYSAIAGSWPAPYWYSNFYALERGLAMGNGTFATDVDPVSVQFMDNVFGNTSFKGNLTVTAPSVINKSNVTEQMYNSVRPYFYLSTTSSGLLNFSNPTGNTGNLRNMYPNSGSVTCLGVPSVTGGGSEGNTPACAGTAVVMFVPVWPQTQDMQNFGTPAQKQIIADVTAQVRSGALTKIDSNNFPVNVSEGTVGGIPLKSLGEKTVSSGGKDVIVPAGTSIVASTISQDEYATDIKTMNTAYPNLVAEEKDGVFMAVYYDYNKGYDAFNPAAGIVKIGFVHVKKIIYASVAGKEPDISIVVLDSYFQKYAYNPVQ